MNRTLEHLGIGAVAVLLGYGLVGVVPSQFSTYVPFEGVRASIVQTGVLAVSSYAVLASAVAGVHWLTRGETAADSHPVASYQRPEYVIGEVGVTHFGVDWDVLYGRGEYQDERYAYAEKPRCPDCGETLSERTERHRFRRDTEFWKCLACPFSQERPSEYLHDETARVEQLVEEDLHGDGGESSLQSQSGDRSIDEGHAHVSR
jgi:predicted RNA-binding Zn-ribbon protein involved in translation (DUF1610 family)